LPYVPGQENHRAFEAANTSTHPTEREAARLQCQARFHNQRAGEINDLGSRTAYQQFEKPY